MYRARGDSQNRASVCSKQHKFDLSLVAKTTSEDCLIDYKKLKPVLLKVQVIDDSTAFAYPAKSLINCQQIQSIVSYIATYNRQAKTGEWIEVSGLLEELGDGIKRIVVGLTRKAEGECIKVICESSE